jgi:ribosomal protein L22
VKQHLSRARTRLAAILSETVEVTVEVTGDVD